MSFKNLYATQPPRWVVFVLAIMLCQFAYNYFIEQQEHELAERLELEGLESTLVLAGELEGVERELMGVVSFFNASETVKRSGFKTYVTPLLKHNNFIDSLMWIPRVRHNQRHSLESRAQEDGYDGFKISVFDEKYSLIPAPTKDAYFPILYSEPRSNIDALLGLDVSVLPTLFNFMEEARASGKPVVTNTQYWFKYDEVKTALIFAPVYSGEEIFATDESRKRQFRGVVLGAFRMDDMFEHLTTPYMRQNMSLAVIDEDYRERSTGKAVSAFYGLDSDPTKIFGKIHEDAVMEYESLLSFLGRRLSLIWQAHKESHDYQGDPIQNDAAVLSIIVFIFMILMAIICQIVTYRSPLHKTTKSQYPKKDE